MRLHVRYPASGSDEEVERFVEAAEASAASVAGVYVPDSQMLFRDPYVAIALALHAAPSLVFTVAATNFATRHWTVTRAAVESLAEAAPGRIRVALAVGDSAVGLVGVEPTPREEFVDLLSAFVRPEGWRRGRSTVLVAANAPRLLEAAGRLADGIVLQAGVEPAVVGPLVRRARAAAAGAGRDPAALVVACSVYFSGGLSGAERVRELTAKYLHASRRDPRLLERAGIPPAAVAGDYRDHAHGRAPDTEVDPALLDLFERRFVLTGGRAETVATLAALERVGVTEVCAMPLASGADPLALVRAVAREGVAC